MAARQYRAPKSRPGQSGRLSAVTPSLSLSLYIYIYIYTYTCKITHEGQVGAGQGGEGEGRAGREGGEGPEEARWRPQQAHGLLLIIIAAY